MGEEGSDGGWVRVGSLGVLKFGANEINPPNGFKLVKISCGQLTLN